MNLKYYFSNEFLKQKAEEFSAFFVMFLMLNGEFLGLTIWILWLIYGNFYLRLLWIAYLIFMIYDRRAEFENSRGQGLNIVRDSVLFKYFVNYFPINLVKTVDLPPDRNYILGIFPHGILCLSALGNFGTNASKFNLKFPGIRSKICTLSFHFYCPLFRELVLCWGMLSSNASSITKMLMQSNDENASCNCDGFTSNAVGIIVGGAQEALNSSPGVYKLVLRKRKGFIKIALKTGASLVPVFSFGEVDIYEQKPNPPGSFIRRFQEGVKKWTGVAPAIFKGHGFFLKDFGIIPFKKPLTTVVGSPISVVKNPNPTQEDIEQLHEKFMKDLELLFDTHKHKYLENGDKIKLIIE